MLKLPHPSIVSVLSFSEFTGAMSTPSNIRTGLVATIWSPPSLGCRVLLRENYALDNGRLIVHCRVNRTNWSNESSSPHVCMHEAT